MYLDFPTFLPKYENMVRISPKYFNLQVQKEHPVTSINKYIFELGNTVVNIETVPVSIPGLVMYLCVWSLRAVPVLTFGFPQMHGMHYRSVGDSTLAP